MAILYCIHYEIVQNIPEEISSISGRLSFQQSGNGTSPFLFASSSNLPKCGLKILNRCVSY